MQRVNTKNKRLLLVALCTAIAILMSWQVAGTAGPGDDPKPDRGLRLGIIPAFPREFSALYIIQAKEVGKGGFSVAIPNPQVEVRSLGQAINETGDNHPKKLHYSKLLPGDFVGWFVGGYYFAHGWTRHGKRKWTFITRTEYDIAIGIIPL